MLVVLVVVGILVIYRGVDVEVFIVDVDDLEVLLVELCFVVICVLRDIVGEVVEKVVEVSTVVVVSIEVVGIVDV